VDPRTTSRRSFLRLALGAPLAGTALAACGSSGPSQGNSDGGGGGGGGGAGDATYWFLSGPPSESVRTGAVERFNKANPDGQIGFTTFQNDAYKTKIKTAIGAGQAPTIIWGWGGGTLRTYAEAEQVEDLTSWFEENKQVKDRLFPASFGAAEVDGKIYAMPCESVEPIVLYYNKEVFEKAGAQPPQSWGDVLNLVSVFNGKGIAPFSLGGQSRWTNMMWLELLFDRIGGSEVFQAVVDGDKDAWSNPGSIQALTEVQKLVKANGFIKGFSSITADSNADQALLYTGKAAMMVHGSWSYGIQQAEGGDFVSSGKLGWMSFPVVDGGEGDPSDQVGNPGQYLSISSKATDAQKEIAKKFFATGVLDETEQKQWIETGSVPIVNGAEKLLGASEHAEYLKFVYDLSSKAKAFTQSWDQALSPTAAERLLDNIAQLFQLSISPQQFASNMNQVIGT
jgi:raffinose/stachyose/melibiose transport system substrate-binding protein